MDMQNGLPINGTILLSRRGWSEIRDDPFAHGERCIAGPATLIFYGQEKQA